MSGDELRETVLRLAASPNLCSRRWVTEQYDRYVLGGTVLAMPHDAGAVRLSDEHHRGIALALDGNGRYARLDPFAGAQLALAEAYRNVSMTGAKPVAVTNCLNFGSPEDPGVMWQFAEAARGLADGCRALGIPVTGGNVSFYNQTGATAINPTPVVGVLGVLDDVRRRVPSGFTSDDDVVLLIGETADEFDGSAWASVVHDHLGGLPPQPRLEAERALSEFMQRAAEEELLSAAHDVSDGGLAQALVEASLLNGVGVHVLVEGDPFVGLFTETSARAMVACPDAHVERVLTLLADCGLSVTRLGRCGGTDLVVDGLFAIPLDELRATHDATLPALFG